ncbi:L,D-transpeptidase [Cohnella lupini]|uniref:L,D-transpeptidase-like protein n=1 Tax=Cohnella lupini TaxID=1294267 RepID=A0A3D9IS50_9BACL|nr:L,D-transpeptidase [Cohnella lupini]RED64600.1 L,D-transpeptidase-like protein [Cohnella lupini]
MKLTLWCRVLIVLSALLFIPAVVTAHAAAETVQLEKKFTQYEQFIKIDKATNKLYFFEKGKLVKSFSVATGKKPSYTPEGLFTIREKIKNRPYYKENIKGGDPKNPLGDRWLGLKVTLNGKTSYAYGIHGNNNEKSIGKYVSAGCIRMHNKDVRWLYERIKTSTRVYIVS